MNNGNFTVASQLVLDPELLVAAIQHANLEPCNLSMRPLPSNLGRVVFPQLCLDFATLGPALLFTGRMSVDDYTLVFVTECPDKGRSFNFSIEHSDGYMGFFPPGGMLDAFTPEGYANATLTVPKAMFLAAAERCFPEIPDHILERGARLHISPVDQTRLRGLLAKIQARAFTPPGHKCTAEAVPSAQRELLDAFLTALCGASSALMPKTNRRVTDRRRRFAKAREFITENLDGTLQLEDLCAATGLSRRGIENLFHDSLGVGPNAFLRARRLHRVHHELHDCDPAPGVIKERALRWGFWHMGHFTHDYRRLFGETPGETVRRTQHG
ncbi:MAG: helix-turn-helix domain-containing protein [Luteolibacter sp.]|uniref:helix-turn-helix domain-containing protein n=1 Tax=Luteolibacter sp. TaxID=1962973 RepID=UPI003263B770